MAAVTDIKMTLAPREDAEQGLYAYLSCRIGLLRLDGLTLRRTRGGPLTLTFPCRRDGTGRDHAYFLPIDEATRRSIQDQIFEALGLAETSP